MKKLISVLMAAMLALAMLPVTVLAEDGPSNAPYAFLYAEELDNNGAQTANRFTFYNECTVYDNVYDGIHYNKDTNELCFDREVTDTKLRICANMMGDDFAIRIDGKTSLEQIVVWGDGYGGNLTVKGSGELTVNARKNFDMAIAMQAEGTAGKVSFDNNIKATLYGKECAVKIIGSTAKSIGDAFSFANSQSVDISKKDCVTEQYENIDGVYPSGYKLWGGLVCNSASDPDGVYTVSQGWRGDDEDTVLFWVHRYIYLPKYDTYMEDNSFGDYGSLEFTEDEWAQQTNYAPRQEPSDEPAQIDYYDADNLDADWHYSANQAINPNDPDGLYGYSSYSSESGGVTEYGYAIDHYIQAPNSDKLIKDADFKTIYLTEDEFTEAGWEIVMGMRDVTLECENSVNSSWMQVYKDSNGKKYAVEWGENVYDFTENEGVQVGDNFYYYLEKNESVSVSSLTPSIIEVKNDGVYNYEITAKEFVYNGGSSEPVTPPAPAKISIAKATVTGVKNKVYTGKNLTQSIVVKVSGKTLKNGTDYTVKYTNNKDVGTATLTVTGKGGYTGSVKKAFAINPKATALTKVTAGKKQFTAQWKKQATQTTGYQIQYSLKSDFASAKTVTVSKNGTLKTTVKKLSAKKKYYVRIRTYKTVGKTKYYSAWSAAKTVKTK